MRARPAFPARHASSVRWPARAWFRAPRSVRPRRRGHRPGGSAATATPPAGSAAAAIGRRHGSCRCASRPEGRARARTAPARWTASRPMARPAARAVRGASAGSSSVTHLPSVFCSRTAISAAAALVKVRHWMRSGAEPVSIRRSSRSVSSLVLPDPADAPTKAETDGSDAWSCSALARSRGDAPSPQPPPARGGGAFEPRLLPLPLREGVGGRGPCQPPLILRPPPPPIPPPGQAGHSRRTAARSRAAAATDSNDPARHKRRSAHTAHRARRPLPRRSLPHPP